MNLLRRIRDNDLDLIDFNELQNYKEFDNVLVLLKRLVEDGEWIHSAPQEIENIRSEIVEIVNSSINKDIAPFVRTEYNKMFREKL